MKEHTRVWEGNNITCLGGGYETLLPISQHLEIEVWPLNFYTRELSLIFIWTLKINPYLTATQFCPFLVPFWSQKTLPSTGLFLLCWWLIYPVLLLFHRGSPSLNVLSEHLIKDIPPLSKKILESNFPLMSGIYMQEGKQFLSKWAQTTFKPVLEEIKHPYSTRRVLLSCWIGKSL